MLSLFCGTLLFAQKPVADSIGLVRSLSHTVPDLITGKVSGVGVGSLDGALSPGRS